MIPSSGNNTSGNRAVTASEVPSPTHHIAINATTASMHCPLSLMLSGSGMSKIAPNTEMPVIRTIICFLKELFTQRF
jgi:hypothetical protein